MFCGECGRAVGTRAAEVMHPDSGMPMPAATGGAHAASPSPTAGAPIVRGRDTVILEPLDGSYPELETELNAPANSAEGDTGVEQDLPPEVIEEERVEAAKPRSDSVDPAAAALARPDPFPWGDRGSDVFLDSDEIEQTLIVPRRETGQRFVLQFSTGESVTVHGSGLLGRNPTPQPSEYFDQLVSIIDPGKSVSKTHLEFGQEAGAFWVSDRFSGNGSVVREPESAPRRLVAGKRYRIVRGTRVDIGEQFFVVS
jgi:hypothetical protein